MCFYRESRQDSVRNWFITGTAALDKRSASEVLRLYNSFRMEIIEWADAIHVHKLDSRRTKLRRRRRHQGMLLGIGGREGLWLERHTLRHDVMSSVRIH